MPDTMCKTVRQYNRGSICESDMKKLLEIAADYAKVKNYVYDRYGGINSLPKLYPGYTVQNEMTASGLRGELNLPTVYFYPAVFDALGDIKSRWSKVRNKVQKSVAGNENLTGDEKHFLRYLLKVSNAFYAALVHENAQLSGQMQEKYDALAAKVDVHKLENYLCRQVRKHLTKMHTDKADGFAFAQRAYRYADHGIYISSKENRKRIFIPLTDTNTYDRQLYMKLFPEKNNIEIRVPVHVTVKKRGDYTEQVGIALGMRTMIVTDQGHLYGEQFGVYQSELSDWLREQAMKHSRSNGPGQGRKKYRAKKHRMEEKLHSYINQEINRFFREERPQTIYLPKLPPAGTAGSNKKINNAMTLWQRGYIRSRLTQKSQEQSVTIVWVFAKDISNACNLCNAIGEKKDGKFVCPQCGFTIKEKINAARNAIKRGQTENNMAKSHA